MRIRYDNVTKKITAIDAPDWIKSDKDQTVVDIGNTPLPDELLKFIRFGNLQNPFVSIKDQVLQDEAAAKLARSGRKKALLQKMGLTKQDFQTFLELLDDRTDD